MKKEKKQEIINDMTCNITIMLRYMQATNMASLYIVEGIIL